MASSINPSNIDGTYPVAGQDNDSQGFRDNFTNIKTNFTSAKTEIEAFAMPCAFNSLLTFVLCTTPWTSSIFLSTTKDVSRESK